jgi:GTP-binding protein
MSLFDLRARLEEEADRDLALQVSVQGGNTLVIRGRGELHIGVLLERMRREGYEFQVTSPTIIFKEEAGKTQEPFEMISVDIKFDFLRTMMDKIMARNGNLLESEDLSDDYQRVKFEMTSRAAIGLQSELISETNNDAKYESYFAGYKDFDPSFKRQRKSIFVCTTGGKVTAFGMKDLEKFGNFFIKPGQNVYKGQVIGISKDLEMDLNPCKEKRLTNIRTTEAEEQIRLTPPKILSMEDSLTFTMDDEYLEVTPQQIRIRKIDLNADLRQRKSNERKMG